MPTCPKCGGRVREGMNFCPTCGSALKIAPTTTAPLTAEAPSPTAPSPPQPPYRAEKAEKQEKEEREEKHEKNEREQRYEKRESNFMGPLVGGIVLILIGLLLYWAVTASLRVEVVGAVLVVIVGIVIIVGAMYAVIMAARRHPQT